MAEETRHVFICDVCKKEVEFSRHPWFYGWRGTRIGFWKRDGFVKEKHEYDLCEKCFQNMVDFCRKGADDDKSSTPV